jgi:hypothetical protein
MSKVAKLGVLLLTILLIGLGGFFVVKADDSSFYAELSTQVSTPVYVNQQAVFVAHVVGGEPTFTYEWVTQLYNQPVFIPPYILPYGVNWTNLPSNNYVTLNFSASTPGTYVIQFDVNNSGVIKGADTTIEVLPLTTLLPSPTQTSASPTQTPNPSSTTLPSPSVPEFSWLTILPILLTITIALTIVRKRIAPNHN